MWEEIGGMKYGKTKVDKSVEGGVKESVEEGR